MNLFDGLFRQRDVTVFHHHFLTLLRQHQLHKFGFQRSQRLVRRFVHIHIEIARQREFASQGVFFAGFKGFAAFLRQCHGAHAGGFLTNAGVTNGVHGARHGLHHGRRAGLLVYVRFEIAFTERGFFEVTVSTRHRVTAKQLDGLGCPLAS